MREKITSSALNYFYISFLEASAVFRHPGDLSPPLPSLPGTSRGRGKGEDLQRGWRKHLGGFAPCQEPGGKGEAAASAVALPSNCARSLAWRPKPKAFRSAACVPERRASHPCLGREELLEEGRGSRWRGWKSIGSLRRAPAAGDPGRRLCEEERGWHGGGTELGKEQHPPSPKWHSVSRGQRGSFPGAVSALYFFFIYIYIGLGALRGRERK